MSDHLLGKQVSAPRLLNVPLMELHEVPMPEANEWLSRFQHYLGPVERPFKQQGFVLEIAGNVQAVAVSSTLISNTVTDERGIQYRVNQCIELSRLAAEPTMTRVMLRLWREVCAPAWPYWRPLLAVAYSQNSRHPGDIYRFDGWTRVRMNAGSHPGGAWDRARYAAERVYGKKTLWVWRYGEQIERHPAERFPVPVEQGVLCSAQGGRA